MKHYVLVSAIAIALLLFVLVQVSTSLLCEPSQNNIVLNNLSSMVQASRPSPTKPVDPLSWDPIFHRLLNFLYKACNK